MNVVLLFPRRDISKIYGEKSKYFPYHYLFRSIIVLASRFLEEFESGIEWFTYNPFEQTWIKHDLSLEIKLPPKPHWFLVPILGEFYLFLSNDTLKYHSETEMWKNTEILLNMPIDGIRFLTLAYEQ